MSRRNGLSYIVVVWLVVAALALPLLAQAQAPKPPTAIDSAPTNMNVKELTPGTDPKLDALAQKMADEIAQKSGAESVEVEIFTLPAEVTAKDVQAFYESEMATDGWQPNASLSQSDAAGTLAAWGDNNGNVFITYFLNASADTGNVPVLFSIDMLAVPEFAGAKPVAKGSDPKYDALAQKMAEMVTEKTGAKSPNVQVFTMPADAQFDAVKSFYQAEMDKAGWKADAAASQSDASGSWAVWTEGNNMFMVMMFPAAEGEKEAVLITIGLVLPDPVPAVGGAKVVKAGTNANLDGIAKKAADDLVQATKAESAEVQIYMLPAEATFKDVVAYYDDELAKANWKSEPAADNFGAWTKGQNLFAISFLPASTDTGNQAVLVTMDIKNIPAK